MIQVMRNLPSVLNEEYQPAFVHWKSFILYFTGRLINSDTNSNHVNGCHENTGTLHSCVSKRDLLLGIMHLFEHTFFLFIVFISESRVTHLIYCEQYSKTELLPFDL